MSLTKAQIEYAKNRVKEIASRAAQIEINKLGDGPEWKPLPTDKMLDLIRTGKAKLKSITTIGRHDFLITSFTYPGEDERREKFLAAKRVFDAKVNAIDNKHRVAAAEVQDRIILSDSTDETQKLLKAFTK